MDKKLPENNLSKNSENLARIAQKICDNYRLTFFNPTGFGVYDLNGDTSYRGEPVKCITLMGYADNYNVLIECHGLSLIIGVTKDGILDFSSLKVEANYDPGVATELINLFLKEDSLIQVPFESYDY